MVYSLLTEEKYRFYSSLFLYSTLKKCSKLIENLSLFKMLTIHIYHFRWTQNEIWILEIFFRFCDICKLNPSSWRSLEFCLEGASSQRCCISLIHYFSYKTMYRRYFWMTDQNFQNCTRLFSRLFFLPVLPQ